MVIRISCSSKNGTNIDDEPPVVVNEILVDSLATSQTVALYKNLQAINASGVLFGHQDDTAYGVGWWAESGRSDVKEVCGDYPAVYGWDLGDIQNEKNLDGVNFAMMRLWIIEAFKRGGFHCIR
jgi:mannan endo-1,4-beta-mannosidase